MIKGVYTYNPIYESLMTDLRNSSIADGIKNKFNLVIDETHILKCHRESVVEYIKTIDTRMDLKVWIVWFSLLEKEIALKRRMQESRGYKYEVWESVYHKMFSKFEQFTLPLAELAEITEHF